MNKIDQLQTKKQRYFESDSIDERKDDKVIELDAEIAKELLGEQRKQFEKELKEIKEAQNKKGKSAAVFKVKEKILGLKKSVQEATVIVNPKTKEEVNTVDGIKKVCLDYCSDLLTNREPKDDYKDDLEIKNLLHEVRMEETCDDNISLTFEMFKSSLLRLSLKHKNKYKFILEGGASLKNV